jgi:hypothetical protein
MPSFDEALSVFVNWQTITFCLGIYIITYFLRIGVEYFWKGAKTSTFWSEVALPFGPIGTGLLIAMISRKFPWPMPIADTVLGKAFYGMICGLASGWVYTRFRSWLKVAADKNDSGFASRILGKAPLPSSERPTDPPAAPHAALPPAPVEDPLSDRPTDPPPPPSKVTYPAAEE